MDGSILVVEDDTTTRNLLAARFGEMGYRVCCAGDVAEARALASEIWPDVVLLDRIVKGQPALTYVQQLRDDRRTADAVIIVIGSRVPQDPDAVAALESGADDYLIMPFSVEELLARVKAVVRRRPSHPTTTSSRSRDGLTAWTRAQPNAAPRGDRPVQKRDCVVTTREQEVMKWIYLGKTNSEIGCILGISAMTVRDHVRNLLRKLNVVNRTQAVGKALEAQLL
jgi:DNA-binding NarL/FixJ family response regulator